MDARTDLGVGVFVRMKFAAQAGMQAKRTNRDQQHADQTLRPGGKALDHGGVFKVPKQQTNHRHTGGMSSPHRRPSRHNAARPLREANGASAAR